MPVEVIKTQNKLDPKAGGTGGNKTAPVIGIVKDNIDPTRSGRIKVLLSDKSIPTNSDDSGNWVTVSYLSNFFGMVKPTAGQTGLGDYTANPSSYGEWHAPPDIGTKVVCIFINGDPNYGFYIGCIPEPDALQMVPAIGSSDNILANGGEAKGYGGATRLPVTNINTNDKSVADSNKYLDTARPVHSYTASIMNQQGIIRDPIRGPISSSASREPASRVGWGVSTPGRPIYEGGYDDSTLAQNLKDAKPEQLKVIARRGGHSFVMDDGDVIGRDQLIRIRTALGHQILMSDDGQTLMILHSNGQSYIELGKEGTVDIYSTNSINMRTQGDLNLHADQNINIHAMENLNIQGKNIQTNSEEDTKIRAGKDLKAFSIGNLLGKAGGSVAFAAGGEASLVAGAAAYVNGSKVNLNTGGPGTTPVEVPVIPIIAQTDTLYDQEKGFMAAPAKLLTIASRAPAHAPWANAGQGVNVKTKLDAASALPAAPSPAVENTAKAGIVTNPQPPAVATVASTPPAPPASASMDKGTTAAAISSVATTTATGPAAAAATQGAAAVPAPPGGATDKVAAVGPLGLTPTQMVNSGTLKPGADTLINGLVSAAKEVTTVASAISGAINDIEEAFPSTLFTAVPGANDLTNFVVDVAAQTNSLVNNMQKTQNVLTDIGVLSGKESSGVTSGLVTAGATVGLQSTVNTVKQVAGAAASTLNSIAGAASGVVGGAAGQALNQAADIVNTVNQVADAAGTVTNALKAIGSGTSAAGLADKLGGLGGISNALDAMKKLGGPAGLSGIEDSVKGIATKAFNAVKDSFKALEAGVPQNLTTIAKEAAAKAQAEAGQLAQLGSTLSSAASGLSSAMDAVGSAAGQLENAIGGATGALTGAASSISGAASSIKNAASSVTGAISGATSAITSVTNSVNNTVSGISGAAAAAGSSLTSLTNQVSGAVGSVSNTVNKISSAANTFSSVAGDVQGSISKISNIASSVSNTADKITSAVDTVSSLSGAASALASGGTNALSSAASTLAAGASAASASQLASGLNNLAGGIKSVSSVLNKAEGAVNSIAGLSDVGGLIKDVQSSVMNGLSTVDKLASDIGGQLDNLTSLVSSGLPAGGVAELASAVSALSAGGAAAIKLPAIGFNTTDRKAITDQITAVLGNPKIPMPNLLGEITDQVKSDLEKLQEITKKTFDVMDKIADQDKKILAAIEAYNEAEKTLPSGDPKIAELLEAWTKLELDQTYLDLKKQLDDTTLSLLGGSDPAAGTTGAGGNTASGTDALAAVGDAISGATSLVSDIADSASTIASSVGSATSALTSVVDSVGSGASLSSIASQGVTALETLQTSINTSAVELNNSLAGITGGPNT